MKLTARAQATLRNLIICRQTQLDTRLTNASGSARQILSEEHADIIRLWDEIESLRDRPDDTPENEPTPTISVGKSSRRPGRPKKATVEVTSD